MELKEVNCRMRVYFLGFLKQSLRDGSAKWLTNVLPALKIDTSFIFPDSLILNKFTLKIPENPLLKTYLETIIDGNLLHVISQWGISKQAAHSVRCKKIITVHDLFDPEGGTERLVNELKPCLSDYDAIFVPSKYSYQQLCSNFPLLNSRIQIIPNCVDTNSFKPLAIKRDGIKRLMYVGTEKPSKNLPVLFEAFARVSKSYGNNLELIKVGRPSHGQRENLVKLVHTLGVENSIQWIDWVPDDNLVRMYNLADVYVQPSVCEGFGMPVVEAMACGRPVIANNSSSLPEIVGDAGLLFDNSVEGLVDTLYKVLGDSQIREDMGKRGRKRALNLFTPDRIGEMMLVAYEKMLEK